MTQYNTLHVRLSTSQLNNLKSGIKNGNQVTLKISSILLVILMMKLIFHINFQKFNFKNSQSFWKWLVS